MLKVKVCGMRDHQNIREILSLKPDYMGFIFYRNSPRFVGAEFSLADLIGSFESCKRVGVFVNSSILEIESAVQAACLDVLQLHGDEAPEFLQELRALLPKIEIWKVFQINDKFEFTAADCYEESADKFLFDSAATGRGGSGAAFDWSRLREYCGARPLVLAGGIGPDNVDSLLADFGEIVAAIDINSAVEFSPAVKSRDLVKKVIDKVRR